MNSVTVNHPTRRTWLRAIAVVSLLVLFFLLTGSAWAAPPPKHTPGLSVHLITSQYGRSSQSIHQPAAVIPASDIFCLNVTLNVSNNSANHTVHINMGVNNVSCPSSVAALQWEYFSTITCGGTESGDPSNNGEVQLLQQGSFVAVASDNWFVACYNGLGFPVPYRIVVSAQAEGQLTNIIGDFAFGEQNFGGTFS